MGVKVIVCEKPDQAKNLAAVFGNVKAGDGFVSCGDLRFTWAIGHLFQQVEPGDIKPEWQKWSLDTLPMLPDAIPLKLGPGKSRQWHAIKHLLTSSDTTEIINACDAGREGELIFQELYMMAGSRKPVKRLWISDYTPEGVKRGFSTLKPGAEYAGLHDAARARARADYLFGFNLSRLFSLSAADKISIGRVQTPTLGILVNRALAIAKFKSVPFWTVNAEFSGGAEGRLYRAPDFKETRYLKEDDAQGALRRCRAAKSGKILSADMKAGETKPPLCFDLASLQIEMNTRHGFTASKTLTLAQALYESKKLLTYPRTSSGYLSTELFNELNTHLAAIKDFLPEHVSAVESRLHLAPDAFAVINDKKLSDHHAIIPTAKAPDFATLSEDERRVYEAVCRRFLAAFLPPAKFNAASAWVEVGGERFKIEARSYDSRGWLLAEPWRVVEDKTLPPMEEGEEIGIERIILRNGKTEPPAHFTEATLLKAMIAAGKEIDDKELSRALNDANGLGTPATRHNIIDSLVSRGFAAREKQNIKATPHGIKVFQVVFSLCPLVCNAELTGQWERRFLDMEKGAASFSAFQDDINKTITEIVSKVKSVEIASTATPKEQKEKVALGRCPLCGGDILENSKSFSCSKWNTVPKCNFSIWKEFRKVKITPAMVKQLLADGRTKKKIKFMSMEGKPYEAFIIFSDNKLSTSFE